MILTRSLHPILQRPIIQVYKSTIEYCGEAACGNVANRRVLGETGEMYVCTIPDIDMIQLPGTYPDAESCVSGKFHFSPIMRIGSIACVKRRCPHLDSTPLRSN